MTIVAGNVSQFVWYAPYGEALVDEHIAHYENPLKFSGKELDEITGLYDHGARNRNPVSTLWYGIDPQFEKYPDFSPYNYCAGNPVKLVDLDGREAVADDDNSRSKVLEYIKDELGENHGFSFEDNKLIYTKNKSHKSYNKQQKLLFKGLKKIVENKKYTVNIEINSDRSKENYVIPIRRGVDLDYNYDGSIKLNAIGNPKTSGTMNIVAEEEIKITDKGGACFYNNINDDSNTAYLKMNTVFINRYDDQMGGKTMPTFSSVFFHEILDHGLDYIKYGNTNKSETDDIQNVFYQNNALQNQTKPLRRAHFH